MTRILSFTFLLCLLFPPVFGQTQHLILTTEQNSKWLESLKILPLDQRLLTIKLRLFSDTNVFVKQRYPDKIKVTDPLGSRVYGEGKPTLIIGGYAIIISNETPTKYIVGLTKLMTPAYIKTIFVLIPNDPATTALYGSAGQYGIIVMEVKKKKHLRQFKQLELEPNY
jgi:hypothetical protein